MNLKIFDIELTSRCNAKCRFCPQSWHGVKRDRSFMDDELLDKITGEIGAMAHREQVHVVLCGMGEPLLRKPLVVSALDNLQRISSGRIFTALVSNGSQLSADLLEYDSFRRLNSIQISISGYDRETYENLFGLKHDRVVKNVIAMAEALPGKVNIRAIDLDELRIGGAQATFIEFWKSRGVKVSFRPLHSRGGHLDNPGAYRGKVRQFKGCGIYNYITFVASDGKVLSCCHDILSENVIGDCRVATLTDLIQRKRQVQASGFPGYRICAKCTDFELSLPEDTGSSASSRDGAKEDRRDMAVVREAAPGDVEPRHR